MKKTLLVMGAEIVNTVLRPSFIIFTFGLPLVGFLVLSIFSRVGDTGIETVTNLIAPSATVETFGFIDQGDTIQVIPSDLPEGSLIEFTDETSARQALSIGEINGYYIIPADVVESGEYTLVQPDVSPLSSGGNEWMMRWTIMVNMTGGDEALASQIQYPMDLTQESVSTEAAPDSNDPLAFALPYGITMLFYFMIFGSASTMLASIGKEKQNRVIEVLLLSTTPLQLLTGKIVGRGLVGVMQTVIYTGVGFLLMREGGSIFDVLSGFQIPVDVILWGVVFFVLGYSLYASLMAGAGALAPNTREASQVTFMLLIPLMLPLFFIDSLISKPNSTISLIISFFPFSAPVAMMTRIATGVIPFWQPLLAALVIGVTAVFVVLSVSRLFRAQTLLSGQDFNPRIYIKTLLGRS